MENRMDGYQMPMGWRSSPKFGRESVLIFRRSLYLASLVTISCATTGVAFHWSSNQVIIMRRHRDFSKSNALVSPLSVTFNRPLVCSPLSSSNEHDPDSADDQDEWNALIAAFRMYKAAYGDLRVPLRFIVPSMPPWPRSAWGMKLGHRVTAIRSTGKYIHNNEDRRKLLEGMGFLWRLRTVAQDKSVKGITFQQIFDAVETYKKEIKSGANTFSIPVTFVVPDSDPWPISTRGMPLGKKISTMKGKTFLRKNADVAAKLTEMGVELDAVAGVNDSRFQKVYNALKCYCELYGDLLVPQPFVVPDNSDEWPEETWGLRLGARVNAIRSQGTFINDNPERRAMLDDIGFVWTPPTERGRKRGRMKRVDVEAEEAQFEEAGLPQSSTETTISAMDNLFGASFDFRTRSGPVPDSSKWGIEGGKLFVEERKNDDLPKTNVDYVEQQTLEEALQAARERAVQVGIILPMTEDKRIRKGKQYKNIPLYNDDFGEDFVFEDVVDAIAIYKKIYGDFSNFTRENIDFVVPEPAANEVGFEATTSFGLAASTRAAAAVAAYENEGRASQRDDEIAAEMQRLQDEESPSAKATLKKGLARGKSFQWPEHLAGMQLGYIVKRIRDGSLEVKHLPDRKAALDAIDFDWGEEKYFLDIPFEKAMCAFYGYYMVRGDLFVSDDFVMPNEDPWPVALAGYEIGRAVKRVRELQNFIEAYHPDKEQMLRMLEFVWFPSLALPLNPTEGGPTMEHRICESYGHPNYFDLPEIPPTLIEKIFENGPVTETDDPKQWYKRYYDWEYVKDLWYDLGSRDRAFALHRGGYPELAAEHAEKYGTGYYDELFAMLDQLHDLTKDLGTLNSLEIDSKKGYIASLLEWRAKIAGTCDFSAEEQEEIDQRIDDYLADILGDADETFEIEATVSSKEPQDSFDDDGAAYEEVKLDEAERVQVEAFKAGEDTSVLGLESTEEEEAFEIVDFDEEYDFDVADVRVEDELGLGDS